MGRCALLQNTDWSLLLKSDIDVLNFDAYGFFDRLFLYKDDLVNFMNRGKHGIGGIVPRGKTLSAR